MTHQTIALIAIAPACLLCSPKRINLIKRRVKKFRTLMIQMIALVQMYPLCLRKKIRLSKRRIEKMNDLELTYLSQIEKISQGISFQGNFHG